MNIIAGIRSNRLKNRGCYEIKQHKKKGSHKCLHAMGIRSNRLKSRSCFIIKTTRLKIELRRWRREQDLNLRMLSHRTLSKRVRSTTPPSLLNKTYHIVILDFCQEKTLNLELIQNPYREIKSCCNTEPCWIDQQPIIESFVVLV